MANVDDDGFGSDIDVYIDDEEDDEVVSYGGGKPVARSKTSTSTNKATAAHTFLEQDEVFSGAGEYEPTEEETLVMSARDLSSAYDDEEEEDEEIVQGGGEFEMDYEAEASPRKPRTKHALDRRRKFGHGAVKEKNEEEEEEEEEIVSGGGEFEDYDGFEKDIVAEGYAERNTLTRKIKGDGLSKKNRRRPLPPSLEKTKARLEHFHQEAMSFLDRGYANVRRPNGVDTDGDGKNTTQRLMAANTQVRAKRKIDREKARLQQFHHEALSFLKKAYDSDNDIVNDVDSSNKTPLRKGRKGAIAQKGQLRKFHEATMMFLEKAYNAELSPRRLSDAGDSLLQVTSPKSRRNSNAAERDKRLLEGYYNEAVSFLDKAYNNDQSVTVEEERIGPDGEVVRSESVV